MNYIVQVKLLKFMGWGQHSDDALRYRLRAAHAKPNAILRELKTKGWIERGEPGYLMATPAGIRYAARKEIPCL